MQILGTITFMNSTSRSTAALLINEPDQETGTLYLAIQDGGVPYAVEIAQVSAPMAGEDRRFTLTDGNVLHFPTDTIPDELSPYLPPSASRWRIIHNFEQVNPKGMLVVLLLIIGILYGFRQSIEPVGDFAARLISPKHEQIIGETTLAQLDLLLFKSSELEKDAKQRLEERFKALLALQTENNSAIKLVFRSAPAIGPNAFALPGNIIVLLDEMVEFADDDDLITAILAHEIAHVTKRHAMRYITRSVLLTTGAAVIFGADDSVLEELASIGGGLVLAKFSRAFELEADQQGAENMQRLGLDPDKISILFDKIEAECSGNCDGGGYFSSHPSFAERRSNLDRY